jgi:phosphatidylinositol alpha-mannosyltransferase
VLFVGRLEKRKGFRYLLEAFRFIKAAAPDARLLVVGQYEQADARRFVRYVRRHRLKDVHFVGYVSNDDLPRYYRTASVCCVPSTGFESFGIVLLEAMASGTPVVASNIPGYREVLTNGREGVLVPPANAEALASAVLALLNDMDRRRRMGQAGQATAYAYRWETIAEKIAHFYQAVLTDYRRRLDGGEPEERRWHELTAKISGWLEPRTEVGRRD